MSIVDLIVCIKQVIEPEALPSSFEIDPATNKVRPPKDISQVIDPYAENALEAALRIKDSTDCRITVLSLGNNLLRDVVKKPLAMGADEIILLEDEAFEDGDSWSTAYALASAMKKIGRYDVIFCGREASDWNAGQVGSGIAEILGLPSLTLAQKVDVIDGKAKVERVTDEGYETIEVDLPAVITVSSEIGEPRYASVTGIMAAKKIEPTVWKPVDIGLDACQTGDAGRRIQLLKLFQPVREGNCEIIEGESLEEAGANLAVRLRGAKVL